MPRKTKRSKVKRGAWFIPLRGSYLPASPAGWWTYVPFVGYLLLSAVVGIKIEWSKTSAILYIAVSWITATLAMTYIAARKS